LFTVFLNVVRALAKNSSFGFFSVGYRVGKKPKVLFVRLVFGMKRLVYEK
jgi:hypothetical protein